MFRRFKHKYSAPIDITFSTDDTPEQVKAKMCLTQITYLHDEMISIQSSFLAMIYIPLAFLGVLIYYAYNSDAQTVLFLLLPFLFAWSMYNLLKYTMKMLGIDAYTRHLEKKLNKLMEDPTLFLWQDQLIYQNGYSLWGILGQIPCMMVITVFLVYKFVESILSLELPVTEVFSWLPPKFPLQICIKGFVGGMFCVQVLLLAFMAVCTAKHYFKVLEHADDIDDVQMADSNKV